MAQRSGDHGSPCSGYDGPAYDWPTAGAGGAAGGTTVPGTTAGAPAAGAAAGGGAGGGTLAVGVISLVGEEAADRPRGEGSLRDPKGASPVRARRAVMSLFAFAVGGF